VEVVRGRAEEISGRRWGIATARAVAPLPRLLPWLAPLVVAGGSVLAFKGASAPEEMAAARAVAARLGLAPAELRHVGSGMVDPPTTVVRYRRPPA
jgi:16S rRNA (guanine527-N7)-methyltransferase